MRHPLLSITCSSSCGRFHVAKSSRTHTPISIYKHIIIALANTYTYINIVVHISDANTRRLESYSHLCEK